MHKNLHTDIKSFFPILYQQQNAFIQIFNKIAIDFQLGFM